VASRFTRLPLLGFALCLMLSAPAAAASPADAPTQTTADGADGFLVPHANQFEFSLENMTGFIGPGSIVRVRENTLEGTGLHFPALGINTVMLPQFGLTWWINSLNALQVRFRYFDVGGDHSISGPVLFNGATLAPGQTLHTDPTDWFSISVFYQRRLRPLYAPYEERLPPALRGWDLRAGIGLVYTYINFSIDNGHAPVTPTSVGEESKEDFMHQELPIPTILLDARRALGRRFLLDLSFEGNWINRWNSLRNEGGTVWLSQNGVEAHARILYNDPALLGPFHPMAGMFLYHYSQLEDSHEDGNFIRWFTYGPEWGVSVDF
jgi:hypothetical protein